MKYYENLVYTILHSTTINKMIKNNETVFEENKSWRGAYNFLQDAKSKGEKLIVVFCPSEAIQYLYAFAEIQNIQIEGTHTTIQISNLKLFEKWNIDRTSLRKVSDGNYIDENYIRTYLLCKSEDIIEYIEDEISESNNIFQQADEEVESSLEENEENSELLQTEFIEGSRKQIVTNRYERSKEARQKCIEYYGAKCFVCGFDFGETYGPVGAGFIHVHHLVEVSSIGEEYKIDPINDMRPLCPNCHAMIHSRKQPFKIEELKKMFIENHKSGS